MAKAQFSRAIPASTETEGIVEAMRRALAPHSGLIKAAFIFGSVAKGTDTAQSDIDLMVIGELDYDGLYAITDTEGPALGREISPVLILPHDWGRETAMPGSFVSKVRAAPKLFVFGSDADL